MATAVVCTFGVLFMGFGTTDPEPWEPVVYPAGIVAGVVVPLVVGWVLLRRRRDVLGWLVGSVATVVALRAVVGLA